MRNFQRIGAFNFAAHSTPWSRLSAEEAAAGSSTFTSGTMPRRCSRRPAACIDTRVVSPRTRRPIQSQATEGYGAEIVSMILGLEARRHRQDSAAAWLHHDPTLDHIDASPDRGPPRWNSASRLAASDRLLVPCAAAGF